MKRSLCISILIVGFVTALGGSSTVVAEEVDPARLRQEVVRQEIGRFLNSSACDEVGDFVETAFIDFSPWLPNRPKAKAVPRFGVGVYQLHRPVGNTSVQVSGASVQVIWQHGEIDSDRSSMNDAEFLEAACGESISDFEPSNPCIGRDASCYAQRVLRLAESNDQRRIELAYRVLVPQRDTPAGLESGWTWRWQDETTQVLPGADCGPRSPHWDASCGSPAVLPIAPTPQSAFPAKQCQEATLLGSKFEDKEGHRHWSTQPLPEALVTKGRYAVWTDDNGRFCGPMNRTTEVHLRSPRFIIYGLDGEPIVKKYRGQPFVLASQGDPWREIDFASALFGQLHEVLDFFKDISPPTKSEERPLNVFLTSAFGGTGCHARIEPGNIFLPLVCRRDLFFEPKAICPEVITHEVAHEVFNHLLFASTGTYDLGVQRELGETLADFVAMVFQQDPILGQFCSDEVRWTQLRRQVDELVGHGGNPPPLTLPQDAWKIAFRLWLIGDAIEKDPPQNLTFRSAIKDPHRSVAHLAREIITRCLLSTILRHGDKVTYDPKLFVQELLEFVKLLDDQGDFGGKLFGPFRKYLEVS